MDVDFNKLSPMMKQYMEIKDQYNDCLLFYRLGDFYELFFEDGEVVSRQCELTLTGKNAGLEERIPMCGVPYHSVKPYIEKLVNMGYKIAICEQLTDPKTTKGMVERGVVNVISKGTISDLELLNASDSNYIGAVYDYKYDYALTYADISTGNIYALLIPHVKEKLLNAILNLDLKEVILNDSSDLELINLLRNHYNIEVNVSSDVLENNYESVYENIKDVKIVNNVKQLLYYLVVKRLKDLSNMQAVEIINFNQYLEMDTHTIANLELVETIRLKERNYSLLWFLDKTKTAMGARLLKNYLINPIKDQVELEKRYHEIEVYNNEFIIRDELRNLLYEIYDIERLIGKIAANSINPRELINIKSSLAVLPRIKELIKDIKLDYHIDTFGDIYQLIDAAIVEDNTPITLKDGGVVKPGFNKDLDELKQIRSGGKNFIAELENYERERTGIKTLKVGYNRVFGYYIEVSKGALKDLKPDFGYERRQTLTTGERFISPELKEKEALVLNAEEKIVELETEIFANIKETIKKESLKLKELATTISKIDCMLSLAIVADENNLVRPILNNDHIIEIIDGRHPVVEKVNHNEYVKNDIIMDKNTSTLLITGPNMSGKSTYMRQLAITAIMAQIGSFVPAKSAKLPIFDKIFTRIGASDDLVSGESTFMVEMLEAKNAIVNATSDSLILFDELGRGTATYDGMSLAQAILEYITKNIKAKTLFSTHYHELTSLENKLKGLKNVHVSAEEDNGKLIFLHKVKNGSIDKSYGINVAKLANMPDELLDRAQDILSNYENNGIKNMRNSDVTQLSMDFMEVPEKPNLVKERLDEINPLEVTPMDAINILYELKELNKK
ncbi:MAG: DNA mismatch repair protein MutS [Bacilli bacterium]|nr:DNA mismatch repair protein MutS [Bacilli bacterium]